MAAIMSFAIVTEMLVLISNQLSHAAPLAPPLTLPGVPSHQPEAAGHHATRGFDLHTTGARATQGHDLGHAQKSHRKQHKCHQVAAFLAELAGREEKDRKLQSTARNELTGRPRSRRKRDQALTSFAAFSFHPSSADSGVKTSFTKTELTRRDDDEPRVQKWHADKLIMNIPITKSIDPEVIKTESQGSSRTSSSLSSLDGVNDGPEGQHPLKAEQVEVVKREVGQEGSQVGQYLGKKDRTKLLKLMKMCRQRMVLKKERMKRGRRFRFFGGRWIGRGMRFRGRFATIRRDKPGLNEFIG